jgi:NAD(P)-dependent dehydrogenase (short-subunit alcohol dehydrogenase family)
VSEHQPVALITGTSRGLGHATAIKMMAHGYAVVGVSRTPTDIDDEHFTQLELDIAEDGVCEHVVREVIRRSGRIDVLINNAAALVYGNCWELEPRQLSRQLRINLTAPFLLSREVVRRWLPSRHPGVIVNVCSVESEVAWKEPPQAGYAITKGGLVGLTRAMAHDLAPVGIRINGVAPGIIRTEMTPASGSVPPESIPIGRPADPTEIAEVIAFVASPAASYMTGEIVYADGGYRLP